MKKSGSFKSLMAGVLAISALTMCKKKEEAKPNSDDTRIEAASVSNCTMTIETTQWNIDGSKVAPGSVVCIAAGKRGALLLNNFKGTADKPITFINKGGKVLIQTPTSQTYGFKTIGCSNFKVLGNGDPSIKYGIEIDGANISMQLDQLSTDFEVANVEIHNSGFAGMMAKTDPSCDKATWRGNFTMRNISIHDNYSHHTGGEGFYIGNSFYANGRALSCGSILPHSIENIKVFNNITDATSCEGIQVGCAIKGLEVYNNRVTNFGLNPFQSAQNNGIQIGEGSGGLCYNNIIKNGPGNGIVMLGLGDNVVYNNLIINPGAYGIFCDERYTPGPGFKFINNTIINAGMDGMRLYSELVPMNYVVNNIIIKPGSGIYLKKLNNNVKITELNNYYGMDIAALNFVNAAADDYRVKSGSPVIDKGANASAHGVKSDYYGLARPMGAAYDIGATEFKSGSGTVTPPPTTDPGTTAPAVTSLTLVNADTDKDIATLTNGYQINLATIGTKNFNIRANINNGTYTKSVVFTLNNAPYRTESGAPFTFAGDGPNNDYYAWTPKVGSYTVGATPYAGTNASGIKGTVQTVTFTVVNNTTTPPPATGGGTVTLKPVADVHIEGSKVCNYSLLMTAPNLRTAYLKFNVTGLGNTKPKSVKLRLRTDSFAGTGTVQVGLGSNATWTESTITAANKPYQVANIASLNNAYALNTAYEFDVTNAIKADGSITLILNSTKDMGFSSSSKTYAPELIITK